MPAELVVTCGGRMPTRVCRCGPTFSAQCASLCLDFNVSLHHVHGDQTNNSSFVARHICNLPLPRQTHGGVRLSPRDNLCQRQKLRGG